MRDGFSPVRSRPGVIIEPGGVCNASWVHSALASVYATHTLDPLDDLSPALGPLAQRSGWRSSCPAVSRGPVEPNRRAAVELEGLSARPCLSSLSSGCRVAVEPVEADCNTACAWAGRVAVEVCRGLRRSCDPLIDHPRPALPRCCRAAAATPLLPHRSRRLATPFPPTPFTR